MRRTLGVSIVLMLLATLGGVAFAGQSSADDRSNVLTFTLIAEQDEASALDLGDEGVSAGDQIVFKDRLLRNGSQVGLLLVHCTGITLEWTQCVGTVDLPRGQITAQVAFQAPPFTIAITGGSGAYKTAHGQIRASVVDEEHARYRFKVIL